MSTTPMAFNPAGGLNDTATYPSTPSSETAARAQIQGRLDEVKNHINNTLIPAIDAGGVADLGVTTAKLIT